MALGLSSMGRLESRVLPTIDAVLNALSALAGGRPMYLRRPPMKPHSSQAKPAWTKPPARYSATED